LAQKQFENRIKTQLLKRSYRTNRRLGDHCCQSLAQNLYMRKKATPHTFLNLPGKMANIPSSSTPSPSAISDPPQQQFFHVICEQVHLCGDKHLSQDYYEAGLPLPTFQSSPWPGK
jgi:hypothetical protein